MSAVSPEESAHVQLQRVRGHQTGGGAFQLQAVSIGHRQILRTAFYSGEYYTECTDLILYLFSLILYIFRF